MAGEDDRDRDDLLWKEVLEARKRSRDAYDEYDKAGSLPP